MRSLVFLLCAAAATVQLPMLLSAAEVQVCPAPAVGQVHQVKVRVAALESVSQKAAAPKVADCYPCLTKGYDSSGKQWGGVWTRTQIHDPATGTWINGPMRPCPVPVPDYPPGTIIYDPTVPGGYYYADSTQGCAPGSPCADGQCVGGGCSSGSCGSSGSGRGWFRRR